METHRSSPFLRFLAPGAGAVRALLFRRVNEVMERAAKRNTGQTVFDRLLEELDIQPALRREEIHRIPAEGPLVIVSNHPFGMLEGAVLAALCLRVRPDVRMLANYLMPRHELLREYFIFVDPYGRRNSVHSNRGPLRQAVNWLRSGGALIVFPSGDVSYPDWKRRGAADPDWSPSVARLIRLGGAAALPVYFEGGNSAGFHLLGMVHPRLRTLRLPAEFLNKRRSRVELRIGRPLPASRLAAMNDEEMTGHLRARTYLLAHRPESCPAGVPGAPLVRAPRPAHAIARLIGDLPGDSVLKDGKEWTVYCLSGPEFPELLDEIGRLREEAFRAAGEGTGQARDIDRFDSYYEQLVLWNKKEREIAGGHRLGRTELILRRFGIPGLYTSTLFRFQPEFFDRIGPALELGRSFVVPKYQRQYAPLLTLWEGIGAYLLRYPECRYLFGAVSVSADYQMLSRQILVSALLRAASDPELARFVEPRCRLKRRVFRRVGEEWERLVIRDPAEVSDLLADLEPDGKGLPVLLRQYLRLGGRVLAFSVDRRFSETLDGLVVVDLLRTDPTLLHRYMTKEGAARFLRHHGCGGGLETPFSVPAE